MEKYGKSDNKELNRRQSQNIPNTRENFEKNRSYSLSLITKSKNIITIIDRNKSGKKGPVRSANGIRQYKSEAILIKIGFERQLVINYPISKERINVGFLSNFFFIDILIDYKQKSKNNKES